MKENEKKIKNFEKNLKKKNIKEEKEENNE